MVLDYDALQGIEDISSASGRDSEVRASISQPVSGSGDIHGKSSI